MSLHYFPIMHPELIQPHSMFFHLALAPNLDIFPTGFESRATLLSVIQFSLHSTRKNKGDQKKKQRAL